MFKKVLIHTRRGLKLTILTVIAAFLIIGTIAFLFKPTYSVTINGEQVGYTENRAKLQHEINNYAEKGDGEQQNVAFVQIQNLPEYKLCLLKKNIVTNDEEILNKIKEEGTTYYRYYAIAENQEEKLYVSNFEEAEQVVNSLKEKNSTNIEQISIVEKYETDIQDLVTSEEAISKLYVEPAKKAVTVAKAKTQTTTKYASSGSVNTAGTTSTAKASIGISLIKPVSGIITSRFGAGSAIRRSAHTGLDIATSTGTPIQAAAYVAIGIAGIFLFHTLENIGMTMGVLPITGVPLLFVSYGGSSMMTSFVAIGILLNISSQRRNGLFNK